MPFRDFETGEYYDSFEECEEENESRRSPSGFCATSKRISEGRENKGVLDQIEDSGSDDGEDLLRLGY